MDDFLVDIYKIVFIRWICYQQNDKYQIHFVNDNSVKIESKYAIGEIIFNTMNVIELQVKNKLTDNIDFYLHFQMKTIHHALELYNEMIESIINLSKKPMKKVLLSCSCGLTTLYFADRISKVVQLLGLDIEVSAVGYNKLFQVGNQYDIILLAPQISYLHAKVKVILKDQTVLKIPPQVFAKYDVGKILDMISNISGLNKQSEQNKNNPLSLKIKNINNNKQILCLSIFKNKERVHIAYRIYQKNCIIINNEIIKFTIGIEDIYDVLDTVLLQYPNISIIGISIPGIINNGLLLSSYINDVENNEIEKAFITRYPMRKIIMTNDVNAAAVGYYATQDKYDSLMLLFQPISLYAGGGMIVNKELVYGYGNFAGEVRYLPTGLSDEQLNLSKTPEGTLELVSKTILSAMCIIAPQAFIIFSDLIPDISELYQKISKNVLQKYIPDIIKVDNVLEYILLGQMVLCAQIKGD